ncbi:MAG TPA: hypothetical protein VFA41_04290 [Ktedonobacteraceae bacterium]|nr:hypothetical protein [Ktedonobacteraceae bacterium]
MNTIDVDEAVEHYHRAAGEFVKGNLEPYKLVCSQREDVYLANPFGPVLRGRKSSANHLRSLALRHF